jgi:predicted nuclease of predicted toxin-antitoxin system
MRLLLDENISPALVGLVAELDVYAQSVPHVGLAGRADHVVWRYALDHDFAVVTTNAQDFISSNSSMSRSILD